MSRQPNRASPGGQRSKRRLVLWLALLSLLVGAAEMGEPLDLVLRTFRDKVRAQPVSAEVVVVGLDDQALAAVGPWPWNRTHFATLTERLFEAGARRVFYDIYFQPVEPKGDAEFAAAVNRHPGRVFVASVIDYSSNAEGGRPVLPMPEIGDAAETVSVMKWISFWNGVSTVPYSKEIGGVTRRSMESAISGVEGEAGEEFPIDYSYRVSSVPYVGIAEVLAGDAGAKLRGKDVLVGVNSVSLGDIFTVPGQRPSAGVFVIALGAETLKQGRPMMLGWFPAWLLALGASYYLLHGKGRRLARTAGVVALAAVLGLPLLLENRNIFVDITPALLLLGGAMIGAAWQRFGAKKHSQGSINPVSGLHTVNAIAHEIESDASILIAVRVRRFANIVSTLPPDRERELVGQIVSRLAMGAGSARMLHGDDGNFIWLLPLNESATLVDRFKALQLIFRSPVKVAEKRFDVDVTFGVDQEVSMPFSHRLSSALAAAHAASDEGNPWKIHDPADTGATEWALSLLGELDQAIDAGDVWVAYQPKMDLTSGAIIGAEALVRWTHATRGPINPAEFVEATERHGRIDRLTAFVLNDAVRSAAGALAENPFFTVSVNMSPSLLTSREVVEMIRDTLVRHRLPASNLMLEITETAAMAKEEAALALLEELRAMGIVLSIDDYGTGLSTLEYLRRIPAGELKVDRRFAASLQSVEDQAIMRSTIELAHILGMKVVAEGIETAETLQMLTMMGCDIGQGYHIGRPMEWEALAELLRPPVKRAARAAEG